MSGKRYWTEDKLQFLTETKKLLTGQAYKLFCEKYEDATTYQAFAVKRSRIGACAAESKKLKWKSEWLDFMQQTKSLAREEAYEQFCKDFPEANLSANAFYNQRSRSKCSPSKPHGSNKKKSLFTESTSKRYVMIKIAEPNVWISKARWIYENAHPGETHEKGAQYFHADGNKNNYKPDNIIKVQARERTLFIAEGGVETGNPEGTKINLLKARMRLAQLDLGEKVGLVVQTSAGRKWIK